MQKRKDPSFFRTKQTGDAHAELEGSITPLSNISFKISSSASRAAKGGLRGDWRIGRP